VNDVTGLGEGNRFDAIVLAGGAGRRLASGSGDASVAGVVNVAGVASVDKALVDVGGRPLIEWVLDAVAEAQQRIVVGPWRPLSTGNGVRWCIEEPPGSGPCAGLAAGAALVQAETVVVLAVDLPYIAGAVPRLRAALEDGTASRVDAAVLVTADGRRNYVAAAWRTQALRAALASGGTRLRDLYAQTEYVADVADLGGWGEDCDTPEQLERARQRAGTPTKKDAHGWTN
jgi:molybdopterin-guanine dinucleotide biosynthesis protein A